MHRLSYLYQRHHRKSKHILPVIITSNNMNTAARDTEGRREIEAAKQRLASAKAHASFVTKTLETAKSTVETAHTSLLTAKANVDTTKAALETAKAIADSTMKTFVTTKSVMTAAKRNRDDIQSQLQRSNKEVEDAQKFLAEAEKRWEVIDVDAEEGESTQNSKKRKVSLSPQANNNNVGTTSQPSNSQTFICVNSSHISEIEVTGAGELVANGTYKLYGSLLNGCPCFVKECRKYMLYYVTENESWAIAIPGVKILYLARKQNNKEMLPLASWNSADGSASSAPKILVRQVSNATQSSTAVARGNNQAMDLTNNSEQVSSIASLVDIVKIVVEGCGMDVVNGAYMRVEGVTHNDDPVYIQPGYSTDWAIFRGRRRSWCIGRWNCFDSSPGTLYYESPSSITGNGWVTSHRGASPAPTCRLLSAASITNRSSNIIAQLNTLDEIIVTSKKNEDDEVNGTYKRSSNRGDLPSFVRQGSYQGQSETFVLYHDKAHYRGSYQSSWIIGIPSKPLRLYQSNLLAEETTLPPKSGWRGEGIELQY